MTEPMKGYNAGLYVNNADDGSSTYVVVAKVRNVDTSLEASEIDATSRMDDGWTKTVAGLKSWGVGYDIIYDPIDPAWLLLQTGFKSGSPVFMAVLDQKMDVDGAEGIKGLAAVTNFSRGEPLNDIMTTSVSLKGSGKPEWVTASGGI